jgi:photosystem II stability/assembly factor-like uncharacterized protein
MTILMVGIHNSVLVLDSYDDYKIRETSRDRDQLGRRSDPPRAMPQCIAFDPQNPNHAYWGTFDNGMLKTDDRGQSWINVGSDVISSPQIMSVAVSSLNDGKARFNKVYAGTEPTALYVSNDGGDTWERIKALNDLPSSKTWRFPPRPWTNHVRWIEPDATNPNYLFVAIEAGALVHSRDGGKNWIDRVKDGPYDTHTLSTHPKAPKRLYSSAGDGYYQSFDYGESWIRPMEGLNHTYLGLAVDSGNPDVVIVSASDGPFKLFSPNDAETYMYKKDQGSNKGWKMVSNGLPQPNGTSMSILESNQKVPGEFYAANNHGIFISTDSGETWRRFTAEWPKKYLQQTVWAITVSE